MAVDLYRSTCQTSYHSYRALLDLGVGREQARGVLVPSVYTTWVWTVSLQSVLHFIGLRNAKDAQGEIERYAKAVKSLIVPIVPEAIAAWEDTNNSKK